MMSNEIDIPETPFWLTELEAKREKRLKARLGHEAGAGAPCLKCGDKCPGLDLHFWRKSCKICKCAKEEHEVQDDDIYGWAQFQLLGSKPNKIKKRIVLPGKKDEIELDWTPKGHNETVDKYLKTLPPEKLPVKGSEAAQKRKQLLQKQIPVHDVDPALCHELTEDELNKMNEYIAHIKQSSVGVGQIVSLSNIIKGNLHIFNPSEAAILANRYSKGIPTAEIVTLQTSGRSESLKQHKLNEDLQKLNLNDKNLPNFICNNSNIPQHIQQAVFYQKIHDVNYPGYTIDSNPIIPTPEFSTKLNSNYHKGSSVQGIYSEPTIDEKGMQTPNFDPTKTPSEFVKHFSSEQINCKDNNPLKKNSEEYQRGNSAFVPYTKTTTIVKPGETIFQGELSQQYTEESVLQNPKYSTNIPHYAIKKSSLKNSRFVNSNSNTDDILPSKNYSNIPTEEVLIDNDLQGEIVEIKKSNATLPNYSPGKYNIFPDHQSPMKLAKNVKNLAFSTYDPRTVDPTELKNEDASLYKHQMNFSEVPFPLNQHVTNPQILGLPNNSKNILKSKDINALPQKQSSGKLLHKSHITSNNDTKQIENPENFPVIDKHPKVNDQTTFRPIQLAMENENPDDTQRYFSANIAEQNKLLAQSLDNLGNEVSHVDKKQNYPTKEDLNYDANIQHPSYNKDTSIIRNTPRKKLSELHPSNVTLNEDFLLPSQVTIGAIQDVNYPEIMAAIHGTSDFYEDYSPDSIKEILNNIKLPECHYCKKSFEENEFAITIDRANVLFHADCFKCAGCNQILADNVYFYNKETDNIYCGRDYAKVRGFPRCKACDELIFTKEYCLAENATFHLKHFCCMECDRPLAGQDYTLDDGMPYCLPCFEQSKANKCNGCGLVIKPDEIGCAINGIHFHADDRCFACKMCKKTLMGEKLLLRNQKLYCSHVCFGADK